MAYHGVFLVKHSDRLTWTTKNVDLIHSASQHPSGVGGTLNFKWQGWSNVGKNKDKKNPLASNKPPKHPWTKISPPKKSYAQFSSHKNFQKALKNTKNGNIIFEYPKKTLLKGKLPQKNTCQNSPTQKNKKDKKSKADFTVGNIIIIF